MEPHSAADGNNARSIGAKTARRAYNRAMDVLVVGAGLAGLACALKLQRAGHAVRVLEASDRPGGRIGSDVTPDGFVLDLGFQMLLTHFPMVQALVDVPALAPCPIDAGAVVRWGDRCYDLTNPVADPRGLFTSLRAPFISLHDKWAITRLTLDVSTRSSDIKAPMTACSEARLSPRLTPTRGGVWPGCPVVYRMPPMASPMAPKPGRSR